MAATKNAEVDFNRKTTQAIEDPYYANKYGLDIRDEKAIKRKESGYLFTVQGFIPSTDYNMLPASVKVEYSISGADSQTNIDKKNCTQVYIDTVDMFNNTRLDDYVSRASGYLKPPQTETLKDALYSLRERLSMYRNDRVSNVVSEVQEEDFDGHLIVEAEYALRGEGALMDTLDDFLMRAGIATEVSTARFIFFILLSRFLDKPIHLILQGSKTISQQLLDTVTRSLPARQIEERTSISNGSLYYTRTKDYWKNKVLFLRSMNKQFRGAATVEEFITNGFLSRHTTESDYKTHQLRASQKIVAGNICFLSYCNDDDFTNHHFSDCLSLRVTENDKDTEAILKYQQMEAAGLINTDDRSFAIGILRAMQSVLKPMPVVIPYATQLRLPENYPHKLRDQPKFFQLIKSVALFHQKLLKPTRDGVICANHDHLHIAAELFRQVLINRADIVTQKERTFIEQLKTILRKTHKLKDNESTDQPFRVPDLVREFRKHRFRKDSPATIDRRIKSLVVAGIVENAGGDNRNAFEYKLVVWDDYKTITKSADDWVEQMKQLKPTKPVKA